jgi:hypothetical protein
MAENAPFLPGLSPVSGKPVHLAFDGGRLTSDAGVLVLAEIERKLRIAAHVTELVTCIKVSLPSSYPYKQSFAGRAQALPP